MPEFKKNEIYLNTLKIKIIIVSLTLIESEKKQVAINK